MYIHDVYIYSGCGVSVFSDVLELLPMVTSWTLLPVRQWLCSIPHPSLTGTNISLIPIDMFFSVSPHLLVFSVLHDGCIISASKCTFHDSSDHS